MIRRVTVLGLLWFSLPAALGAQSFDHLKHADLFPTCTVCHAGIVTPGNPIWPDSGSCATCHDGTVQ
ncbi:MAG TPA: cytochrome c3 family protein, partial [Gemmatimonadales bacterium]|nr:cytochrome c3 family protein [Gemmatimonadales bacterium]